MKYLVLFSIFIISSFAFAGEAHFSIHRMGNTTRIEVVDNGEGLLDKVMGAFGRGEEVLVSTDEEDFSMACLNLNGARMCKFDLVNSSARYSDFGKFGFRFNVPLNKLNGQPKISHYGFSIGNTTGQIFSFHLTKDEVFVEVDNYAPGVFKNRSRPHRLWDFRR